jgi:hypothetical protein
MENVTLTFTPMEHATLVSLVGLSIAVMQNDEELGLQYIEALSSPGVEAASKGLVGKLVSLIERSAGTVILDPGQ